MMITRSFLQTGSEVSGLFDREIVFRSRVFESETHTRLVSACHKVGIITAESRIQKDV